eukprot:GHVU01176738.1.p1 GENE.GHVU01176738.1~~GHVU01176738.1.p1  ORF type:complete len:255 (+),score=3.61 GHVU01176738.1:314-1078(+)
MTSASVGNYGKWRIYPTSGYDWSHGAALQGKLLPQSGQTIQRRLQKFIRTGMRHSVGAIFLSHSHLSPCMLAFKHDETGFCTTPIGKGTKDRTPEQTLEIKLQKYIMSSQFEVGEYLGLAWRAEIGGDLYPYLPLHVSRPKEAVRFYQVTLPPTCKIQVPPGFSLLSVPFINLAQSTFGAPLSCIVGMVSRFSFEYMAVAPPVVDDDSSVKSSSTSPVTARHLVAGRGSSGPGGTANAVTALHQRGGYRGRDNL